MIEVIFWDVGGVFSGPPLSAVQSMARETGLAEADIFHTVFGPYDRDADHPWHQAERGEIPLGDAVREIAVAAADLGFDFEPVSFFQRVGEDPHDRRQVFDKVVELHGAGFRHGIITNNLAEFASGWKSLFDFEAVMETVVDSSEVGLRKPDPRIYSEALSRFGVRPEQAAFLDDMPANIDAANALGITGILMQGDPASALRQLDAALGRA